MEKTTEPPLTSPLAAVDVNASKPPEAPSRFHCQGLSPQLQGEDEDMMDDEEDGFQCPCCLVR